MCVLFDNTSHVWEAYKINDLKFLKNYGLGPGFVRKASFVENICLS